MSRLVPPHPRDGLPPEAGGAGRLRVRPVLMYHSVSPSTSADPYRLRVHPARLESHLLFLRRCGLRGVSLAGLLEAQARGRAGGLVGLTFDDGYADFGEHALPVLARYGMTATVYVVAGQLGGHNHWDEGPRLGLLNAAELAAVAAAGHEVGSHSMTHARLSGASSEMLASEIVGSRRRLEDTLGVEIPGFCYPYGDFDPAAVQAVRRAGYRYACVTGDYLPGTRFTVPRCYVSPRDQAVHLLARLGRHHVRQRTASRRHARDEVQTA